MPACPGGTAIKPGAPDQGWLDIATFVAAVAANVVQPIGWAVAAYAASLVQISDICARNPDPPQPLTAQDIIQSTASFAVGPVAGTNKVLQYIGDWLVYDMFLRNCDCAGPAPPTAGMCPYSAATFTIGTFGTSSPIAYDIPQSVYDSWPVTGTAPNQDWKFQRQGQLGAGATSSNQLLLEWSSDQVTWHVIDDLFTMPQSANTCSEITLFLQPPRMTRTGWVRVHNQSSFARTVSNLSYCFCGLVSSPPPNNIPTRDPGTPDLPPGLCTTEDLCLAINDLNRRLNQIGELVVLIQRYSLPFATVPGAVHTSLTGSGSFPVSRLIGMRVDVTSHLSDHPDLEGNPPYVWDQGWMSILTGDGMIEEKRLSQTHFEWLPKQMPLALTFGYSLRPGTVVTFTELQAET